MTDERPGFNTSPHALAATHAALEEIKLQFAPHYRVIWYNKPGKFVTETWHLGAEDDREGVEERAWEAVAENCARNGYEFDATEWVIARVYIAHGQ